MLSKVKNTALNFVVFSLFYSKILMIINFVFNNIQFKKNTRDNIIFPYFKRRTSKNVQILTYHRVNNENDAFFSGIDPENFEKHMEYLASDFSILPLEEAIERMKKNDIQDNALVITFDDGYRDVYFNAYPILKKFSIPATIFLATGCVDAGEILWHDRVFSTFRETHEPWLVEYGKPAKTYSLRTIEDKLRAQHDVLQFLKTLDSPERFRWIDCLTEKLFPHESKVFAEMMLTWDDIKVMHANGISFGSHTVTHPILSTISPEEARWEIGESKRVIESQLGAPVRTFAYPNGREDDFDAMTKTLLQDAGYVCALTTIFGTNAYGHDLFALRRGQPWETDLPMFAAKLNWYKFCL